MNLIKSCCLFVVFSSFLACTSQVSDVKSVSYTEFVNPFIGTDFTGNTYPGAQAPFGMVQLSPDNGLPGWDRISGYFYPDSTIAGFSHTHLSGTGAGDLYDISFMPVTLPYKEAEAPLGIHSLFSHSEESASAGYYQVRLKDYNINVELTATERCGIQRYTFPKADAAVFLNLRKAMNWDFTNDSHIEAVDSVTVQGYRYSDGWARDQRLYFRTRFSKPFAAMQLDTAAIEKEGKRIGTSVIARFDFQTKEGEQILVSTAISGVSMEGAARNLAAEVPDDDFDKYLAAVQDDWNEQLSRIEIKCDDRDEKVKFYTALYHSMIAPTIYSDVDGAYYGPDKQVHRVEGWTNYSTFSLWDTYRAAHPLYTFIEPERVNDMVKSFLAFFEQNGRLPVWNFQGGETDMMIGYHSVPVIVDAYLKGIGDFDAKKALEACVATANIDSYRGIGLYKKYGYVPYNVTDQYNSENWSLSKTLEYAYDDYCIARMAEKLGDKEVADEFYKRSRNYRNVYNPVSSFMQPRDDKGEFIRNFSPDDYTPHICESNGWQYFWSVQQDIDGLIVLTGGKERFAQKLDSMFTYNPSADDELPIFSTGMIGQYAHGNEPSHHMAYLYNYVGQPWKSQQRARQIMDEMYSVNPDGLIGNEDCGQMSAWLVMSAMGFYPVCPGTTHYAIGTPWFPKVTVHLENGKKFTVTALNVSKQDFYIQSAMLNGNAYAKSFIDHSDIMNGGEISFTMGVVPNKQWGVGEGNEPATSIAVKGKTTIPYIKAAGKTFAESLTVALHAPDAGSKILYTTDGRDPRANGKLYEQPFTITSTTEVKLVAVADGDTSFTVEGKFYRVVTDKEITISSKPSSIYFAGGPKGLIDGIRGEKNYRLGGWHGYQGQDFEAVVDLGAEMSISRIAAGLLQDARSWIMMPREVEFYTSNDGKNFTLVAKAKSKIADPELAPTVEDISANVNANARYVKVIARNYGNLPKWVEGVGNPAYIFIDEIVIE